MKSATRDYDRLPAEFIREGYLAHDVAGLLEAGTKLVFGTLPAYKTMLYWAAGHSHIF